MLLGLAFMFYERGGRIQEIVLSKTNTRYVRSATLIDLVYCFVLYYFKEVNNNIYKSKISNMTEFEYFTTPPKLPVGFDIEEIDFKGQMGLEQKYY